MGGWVGAHLPYLPYLPYVPCLPYVPYLPYLPYLPYSPYYEQPTAQKLEAHHQLTYVLTYLLTSHLLADLSLTSHVHVTLHRAVSP